ncbi:MAG TPA: hypothetical protein VF618_11245, partial [Thermoanaerobaculia bacterium]
MPIARRFVWLLCVLFLLSLTASADPYPPVWGSGAVHHAPVAWPATDANWTPYSYSASNTNDAAVGDPSNGGTSPQNYVNVSSGCTDQTLPSIYYYFDPVSNTLMFRWRVGQIANTYATGPSAGTFASTDPWRSALWTVLIDIDGDGFREFAVHLNGSSGAPSTPIDVIRVIYSNTSSQSIDVTQPGIFLVSHNPTAFVDSGTQRIFNFHNSLAPDTNWVNGSSETVWDYGTTRASLIPNTPPHPCEEYFIDYQIPLAMLDATPFGGPQVTANTPMSLAFTTANSLQNPLQKDVVIQGSFTGDPDKPIPPGDTITPGGGTVQQPTVQSITANGCNLTTLRAQVSDTVNVMTGATTVTSVDFYYYADSDGDGTADDGNTWTLATAASTTGSPLGLWSATWNSTALLAGNYLIGVRAADVQGNITWSYLTQAEVNLVAGPTPPNYANPGGLKIASFTNSCGVPPPSLIKTANVSEVTVGGVVTFTLTVSNPTSSPITVTSISDILPTGFQYASTGAGTLGAPSTSPTAGATGTITWTFPSAVVPASSTRTLIFNATAPAITGTYTNRATAATSYSPLTSNLLQIGVGAPRLTIAKAANVPSANPGDNVTFTITYSNDSTVTATNAVITDTLPAGLIFVSSPTGVHAAGTITWNVGTVAPGSGPFSVSFVAQVANPYPTLAAIPLVNTASIDSDQTAPANASSSTYINAPRPALTIQKRSTTPQVAPGGNITFEILYANTGNSTASALVITDILPAGFNYVSSSPAATTAPAVGTNGTVTWNVASLGAGASGVVQVTVQATSPFTGSNPTTNVASVTATGIPPVNDSYTVVVTEPACSTSTTYYFRNTTANVGNAGTQRIANTTSPVAAVATTVQVTNIGSTTTEIARWYQDPANSSNAMSFTGNITNTLHLNKTGSPSATFTLTLNAYDPTTGATTALGSGTTNLTGNRSNDLNVITFASTGVLPAGHRLLWVLTAVTNHASQLNDLGINFDATGSPSRSQLCLTPIRVTLNKQVDSLIAQSGAARQYTLQFSNNGAAALTGAQIVDTLPAGVTFVSALLNGIATAPVSVAGQVLTFNVNTAGQPGGTLAAGTSGFLTINVTVDQPLSSALSVLTNTAQLTTTQGTPQVDSATMTVLRPNVSIAKAANDTLLIPGETVTYTLTVLNAGSVNATNVTVTDVLPAAAWFTYVPNSAQLNGVPIAPDPVAGGTLTYNLGTLTPGATANVTFQMTVGVGAPSGVTTRTNNATVSDTQTAGTRVSNDVVVAVSTNPNLVISKSSIPATGPLGGGDTLQYTILVSNSGSGAAEGVIVTDVIPANTTYVPGSLVSDGTASYNPGTNSIVASLGTIAPNSAQTRSVTFQVTINSPLPAGNYTIGNTATAAASNAPSKDASTSISATSAPELSIVKTAPSNVAFPLTTLAANVAAANTIVVNSSAYLASGDYIRLGGTFARITAISGTTVTLNVPVTGSTGDPLLPVLKYFIRIENNGSATATGVVVSDPLPAGTVYVASSPAASSAPPVGTNGTVQWNVASLAPTAALTFEVWAGVSGTGSYSNVASVDSNETTPVNDSAITSVGVLVPSKTTSTPLVFNTPGGTTARYTITVVNQSGAPATNVVVRDTLSAGFTFASNVSFGGNAIRTSTSDPAAGDEQPEWGAFDIPAGGNLTITFDVDVDAAVGPGTYQNEVSATSASTTALEFDFLATTLEDVSLDAESADLSVVKSDDADPVLVNGTINYTLTVTNAGPSTATSVSVVDTLPAGVTFVSATGTGWTCNEAAGVVTCTMPSLGVATAAPITITITAPGTPGMLTNNVTVSSATADPDSGNDSDSETTNVNAAPTSADLSLVKSDAADPVAPNGTIIYTLAVSNAGPNAADNVSVSDTLPAGVSFVSATGTGWTCNEVAGVVTCTTASLGVGAAPAITVIVTAPATAGTLTNDASVSSDTTDPDGTDNSDDETTDVTSADLAIVKNDAADPVAPNGSIVYTLAVTNIGPSAATSVSVTDTLPAGVTFVSATGTGWTCNEAAGVVTCTTPSLAIGSAPAITITVTAPATAGTLSNNATVSSATSDPNSGNDSDNETTDVASADLSITKVAGAETAAPNSTITYTLTVTNAGPSTATNVSVVDTLPAGVTFVSATGTGWTCNEAAGVVTCTMPSLAVATAPAITLVVTAPATAGLLENNVTVSSTTDDPDGGNNSDAFDVDVQTADLSIVKIDAADPVLPSGNIVYTLTVTNAGPSVATSVSVVDTLPAGVTFVSATGTGWTCNEAAGVVTCTTPNLGVTTAPDITVTVTASGTPGQVSNSATVSTTTTDTNSGNDTDTETTDVTAAPSADLSVVKIDAADPVAPNGSIVYTLTVTNAGPSTATSVSVVDTLPAGVTFVSATGTGWTCNEAAG